MLDKSDEPKLGFNPAEERRRAIQHHVDALQELSDPATRIDGWTPFARRVFLDALADSGKVATACSYVGLARQSAYALRARDPLFAAGWDAACEMARTPLADALYERAIDGFEEVITRDDGRTVTRHRFDSRLSIAVLNRLDRRSERACEQGSRHLGAVSRWDEFVAAIGKGEVGQANAILEDAEALAARDRENPILCQECQLPYSSSGTEDDDDSPCERRRIWQAWDTDEWRTDFPPPAGFDGDEKGSWEDPEGYSRSLTAGEMAALVAGGIAGADEVTEIAIEEDEAERDAFFAALLNSSRPRSGGEGDQP